MDSNRRSESSTEDRKEVLKVDHQLSTSNKEQESTEILEKTSTADDKPPQEPTQTGTQLVSHVYLQQNGSIRLSLQHVHNSNSVIGVYDSEERQLPHVVRGGCIIFKTTLSSVLTTVESAILEGEVLLRASLGRNIPYVQLKRRWTELSRKEQESMSQSLIEQQTYCIVLRNGDKVSVSVGGDHPPTWSFHKKSISQNPTDISDDDINQLHDALRSGLSNVSRRVDDLIISNINNTTRGTVPVPRWLCKIGTHLSNCNNTKRKLSQLVNDVNNELKKKSKVESTNTTTTTK